MEQRPTDRRRHARRPLATAVTFFHQPSGREFPARGIDVSAGGMLVYVPASAPVAQGQYVRVSFPDEGRPAMAGAPALPLEATVVRVDRRRMTQIGYLPVGIRFQGAM